MQRGLLSLAERIATDAHSGQFRRDGVTPYIEHPRAVVARLKAKFPDDEDVQAVGWLHDVLEDTPVTAEQLLTEGVPEHIIDAVHLLTKTKMMGYDSYLRFVSNDPLARMVKIEDMLHNLSESPTNLQIVKYAKGLQFLVLRR